MDTLERIKDLVNRLNKASYKYYNTGHPIMDDAEFDYLLDELQRLEAESGIVLKNSPTINAGSKVAKEQKKITHEHQMLSLDKIHSVDEIKKFLHKEPAIASIKLDGCFTKDTQVLMGDGTYKNICDIEPGEMVKSYDVDKRKICNKRVVRKFYNGKKEFSEWNRLYFGESAYTSNGFLQGKHLLRCTKNHNILTGKGWVESNQLNKNDNILAYNYVLSDSQRSFLLGILLGDGWYVDRNIVHNNKMREVHYSKTSNHNYDVMIEKTKKLFSFNVPKISTRVSGYGSEMIDINLHKLLLPDYMCQEENVLRCGMTFTEDVCEYFNPLTLAILYIDDGSKCPSLEDGYENTFNQQVRCHIAMNRHRKENVEIFSNWLNKHGYFNSFSFEKDVKDKNLGDGYRITLTVEGTKKLFDDICEYIPRELRERKLGLRNEWQNAKEIDWWNDKGNYGLVEYKIEEIKNGHRNKKDNKIRINRKSYCDAYDLEIEDTHTYFANGICVHNCTVSATYINGKLTRLETRGNGEVGTDIMIHKNSIEGLQKKIKHTGKYVVDGECIVTYDRFYDINATLGEDEKFSNPRNMASGSLNLLDSNISAKRGLTFLVWNVIEDTEFFKNSMKDNFDNASSLGFFVVPHTCLYHYDDVTLNDALAQMKAQAGFYGYPMDGVVFSYMDIQYGKSLGKTGHHFNHSVAYKFEDELYETKLTDIEWSTSKSGLVNPVAIFEPVDLDGAITTRATLHNISYIENLQLGIGDTIQIYRSNMVIPKVHDNLTRSNTWKLPTECPNCGGDVEVHNENGSKTLHCTNPDCEAKLLGKLTHFVSKNAANIENLSEQTLEKLIELGWLKSFQDIYRLSEHKDEMSKLDGFGKRSVEKLLDAIEKSRNITLDRFIYALCIPLIGRSASKTIAKHFKSDYDSFHDALFDEFNFTHLDDFGETMNKSLHVWYANNKHMMRELVQEFTFEKVEEKSSGVDLSGKTFVITGSLNHYKNRDELVSVIEQLGGKVSGSVSAKTSYLINNDVASTSGKNKKAKDLGVPIISEEDFLKMIG